MTNSKAKTRFFCKIFINKKEIMGVLSLVIILRMILRMKGFSTESEVKSIDKFQNSGDKSVLLYQSFDEIALLIKSNNPSILQHIFATVQE